MAVTLGSTRDQRGQFVRALLYGDSGVGKTTSLGTLNPASTMIAWAERGVLPLRGKDFLSAHFEAWGDLREIYTLLRSAPAHPKGGLDIGGRAIRAFALDSLTEAADLCQRQIIEKDRKALIAERTKGKSEAPTGIYADLMQMEDWGVYRSRMQALVSAFTKLPLHVVFTSLGQWVEDKKTGITHRLPSLSGKFAQEVPAYFDLVLHMEPATDEEGNATRVFRTSSNGRIMAKDASGSLDEMEPANWPHVFKKIFPSAAAAAKKPTPTPDPTPNPQAQPEHLDPSEAAAANGAEPADATPKEGAA